MKLFPYQERTVKEVFDKFKYNRKLLSQAHTGAGKTVMFSYIAKNIVDSGKKVLILCHREELMQQTIATLEIIGVKCQSITPSTRRIHHLTADVYVAMIETVYNRLKSGKFVFQNIGLVVADECHIRIFDKAYDYFPSAKILGVTATPVHTSKIKFFKCKFCKTEHDSVTDCCGQEAEEWRKPFAFSKIYDDIVVGADIKELIEFGQLVPEISFVKDYADLSGLKTDSSGEYTAKSLDNAYSNDNAAFNVVLNYKELCKGKRTIIFNASTKANAIVYEKLKEAGVNAKMFDSVNHSDLSRKELVEWFKSTPDAVLCNCGIFTTGFDSKEVEAIILNRATASLSLFIQMVGRGGRSSKKIFKDSFIVIDGGENIAKFGEWSSDRDWEDIFWNGIGRPKAKKEDPMDVQDCPECAALFPKNENECPFCGYEIPTPGPKIKEEIVSDDVLLPIREIPPPNAQKIYEYTVHKGENFHFALNVLYSRIVDMFVYYRVTKDKYESAKESGELISKLRKFILPVYFYLIKRPDIQTGANRKLDYVIEKTKEKIEKYYYG